ncbi:casein kinase I delta [Ramaria rubella]|nr:casein kinase I delta [Ramaria rubella]
MVTIIFLLQGAVIIKPTTGRLQEVFGDYQTIKKLGSGTFGEVYLGVDLASNRQVAIKLESIKASWPMLELESKMYAKLRGSAGVPVMKWYGTVRDCNILVLPVLGRSLSSVLHACGGTFSLPTVLMIADQLICRVQSLHANGMIHRDLKPDNFLIGRELWDKTIYVIDLGMAKVYRDERGHHIPWRTNKGFWGNPRYASIGAHEGNEQSRRNDMEALAYILIDCLQGNLPWPPLKKGPDGYDDYKPIGRAKRDTPVNVLCAGMPAEFAVFLTHAKMLAFEAKPDYEGMRFMFQSLASRLGYGSDIQYDWFGR